MALTVRSTRRGPHRERLIDFYVQATTELGMGHLARAGALARQLQARGFDCCIAVDADEHGLGFARSHQIDVSCELRREADVVVIDAVDVSAAVAQILSTYATRVLTSPSFRQADIATHILVRDAPERLVESLASTAQLDVDPRFAFVTAHDARPLADDFTEIRVGLCLTAGEVAAAAPILACLLAEGGIVHVTSIGDFSLPTAEGERARLRHARFAVDPWHFLAGSNVFVGGDGVMVSEAVARALPTFSITTRGRLDKNRALFAAGAIEPVLLENLNCRQLQQRVVDRRLLQQLHDAAKACYHPSYGQALARAIERISGGHE